MDGAMCTAAELSATTEGPVVAAVVEADGGAATLPGSAPANGALGDAPARTGGVVADREKCGDAPANDA